MAEANRRSMSAVTNDPRSLIRGPPRAGAALAEIDVKSILWKRFQDRNLSENKLSTAVWPGDLGG
jgi:hypothetical protein